MSIVVEVGFELDDDEDFELLEQALITLGIPFYVQPRNPMWKSLEDLEIACEGK